MDNRNKSISALQQIWRVGWTQFTEWLINPKMIVFFCLLIFIQNYVVDGMMENAARVGSSIQAFEIFIAIANSSELCVAIPAVFLLLIGDFPRDDGNTLLYIQRTGRYNWLLGQVLCVILSAAAYMAVFFVSCLFFSGWNVSWSNKWSDVTTKYITMFPEDKFNTVANLITGRQYNNFSPYEATGYAISLMFCFLILLAMLKLVFFLYRKSSIGVAIGGVLIGSGWTLNMMDIWLKWLFPMAHVIEWQHCDEIFGDMMVSMGQSYIYFLVLILVLLMIGIFRIDKYNFGYGKQS